MMRPSQRPDDNRNSAQLLLLSGFMIMMGTLVYVVLLNNLILTANLPTAGLDISKQDIKEFRSLVISEVNYAVDDTLEYSSEYGETNETKLQEHFLNYTNDFSRIISQVYATRGTSVELIVNNVTFTSSVTNRTIVVQQFRQQAHYFPNTSIIIPMDENQNNTLQVYRFVWNVINNTSVPVYAVLQDPVNMTNISSFPPNMTNTSKDFSYVLNTTDNISISGNITNKSYSGGPFLIDIRDLNSTTWGMIFNESLNFSPPITLHGLRMSTGVLLWTIKIEDTPKVGVYPGTSPGPIAGYYADMLIPYTLLNDSDILAGKLASENYTNLLIHYNMSLVDPNVTSQIVNWTNDGGVLYAECIGAVTMDGAVEAVDNNTEHTWHGFIGINATNVNVSSLPPPMDSELVNGPFIKLINKSSIYSIVNGGLADPGASLNQLSQNNNTSGMFGPEIGHPDEGIAFSKNSTSGAVNPETNILGYAAYANGSQILYDSDGDNTSESQLAYVEAEFGYGWVVYMAGHDLRLRGVEAQRIAGEIFYAPVSREALALETNNINVTVLYSDGRSKFDDTFLITI